jgi:hypothetical protein
VPGTGDWTELITEFSEVLSINQQENTSGV